MKGTIFICIFLFLLTNPTFQDETDEITITCDICQSKKQCCINGDKPECTSDPLKCPFEPHEDYGILWQILLIVFIFALGLPLAILAINQIFCTPFVFGKSICELLAQNVLCLICLSPHELMKRMKKVVSGGDDDEENL